LPTTSSSERPSPGSSDAVTMPTNGERWVGIRLPAGERQQSVYQRIMPFPDRRMLRSRSRPSVTLTCDWATWTMSVPPCASTTPGRPSHRANAWQSSQ